MSTSTIATSSGSGPSAPSGVSGVRAMATPPSVEPNPSMTRHAEPGRRNASMSRGRALIAVHDTQRVVGIVRRARVWRAHRTAACRHSSRRWRRSGGRPAGNRRRRTCAATPLSRRHATRHRPSDQDRVGVEQRHRQRSRRRRRPSPNRSAIITPANATLPWLHLTALGSPLVPEVKISMNRSSATAD